MFISKTDTSIMKKDLLCELYDILPKTLFFSHESHEWEFSARPVIKEAWGGTALFMNTATVDTDYEPVIDQKLCFFHIDCCSSHRH